MSGIARSKLEAESHLEGLRMKRGFHGANQKTPVSHDLYQTPTHFILELIQNADDNIYPPEVTPSLTLTLQRRYIGEKGIGFKSVFKAADVVKIASGYYEFRFDRRESLGMVLPIASPFPVEHRLSNHTQF
ncbi:hypothetical protein FOC4_h10017656, partial [Fusarium odoratissimum]